jgi:hypothetical protein
MPHFKRPQLAAAIADELIGKTPFSDAPNGLFLAAPRRTGKSEFLKLDLKPALEDRDVLVVYVDLWADKKRSPMELLASELANAVNGNLGLVSQVAKATGLDSITLAGIKIDTSKIGRTDGMTLYNVLALIRKQTGKTIALIIDEAQHALTTPEGDTTMSALKSARDQMRDETGAGLLLVMSGSHRDKLMKLLNTAAAPFWGSQVRALPTLGEPFALEVGRELRRLRPQLKNLDTRDLIDAFTQCGERPQFFSHVILEALQGEPDSATFALHLRKLTATQRDRDRDGLAQIYLGLSPIDQAVTERLLATGIEFRAFDAQALAFYALKVGKKVSAAQAQKAIDRLRENDPPLIWKSLRGDYSLYDLDMQDWYTYLQESQKWPTRAIKPIAGSKS